MEKKLKLTELFMLHFNELRHAANDNPQTLISFFHEKPSFRSLSKKVRKTAEAIERIGDWRKYHAQVSVQFISDWKTYKHKWKKQVDYPFYIEACEYLSAIGLDDSSSTPASFEEYKKRSPVELRNAPDPDWDEDFNPSTHDGGAALFDMMQLAAHELDSRRSNGDDETCNRMANTWNIGIQAIDFLENTIGIELGTAFDRWNKVPSIFVPAHVSDSHGLTEKGSLFDLLSDAIRAYVAGAPAASVAMCRAILETVLREHYLPKKTDKTDSLFDVINLAVAKYEFLRPSKGKLDKLRLGANEILHSYGKTGKLCRADEDMLISFFRDIKFYIEKAPE